MPEIALNPPLSSTRGGLGGAGAAAPSLEQHSAAGDRLLRRGMQRLRWVLAHGRCWVRVWVRPEPVPKSGDSITMHIYDPSQCLKSP